MPLPMPMTPSRPIPSHYSLIPFRYASLSKWPVALASTNNDAIARRLFNFPSAFTDYLNMLKRPSSAIYSTCEMMTLYSCSIPFHPIYYYRHGIGVIHLRTVGICSFIRF